MSHFDRRMTMNHGAHIVSCIVNVQRTQPQQIAVDLLFKWTSWPDTTMDKTIAGKGNERRQG
jgi:hypothetical protein